VQVVLVHYNKFVVNYELRPFLTTDLKSTIKELSESYWRLRGVENQKSFFPHFEIFSIFKAIFCEITKDK